MTQHPPHSHPPRSHLRLGAGGVGWAGSLKWGKQVNSDKLCNGSWKLGNATAAFHSHRVSEVTTGHPTSSLRACHVPDTVLELAPTREKDR